MSLIATPQVEASGRAESKDADAAAGSIIKRDDEMGGELKLEADLQICNSSRQA
jgi:hypothetical protein